MNSTVSLLSGLVGSLCIASGASALVASTTAVVVDISSQYAGLPGYVGLQTWAVYVQYENPTDRMLNHGMTAGQSILATSGTFFNGNAVTDDPLHLIPDASGGLTPISPGIVSQPGYGLWAWDSNLSLDNSPLSLADAGSQQTPMTIHGGAFLVPPPLGATAGVDLLIQVAQITMTAGGTATGSTSALTINPAGGNPLMDVIAIDIPGKPEPCPADLNGDGEINTLDLGILLSSWTLPPATACAGTACTADLNGDGAVNSLDLGILLSSWGGC